MSARSQWSLTEPQKLAFGDPVSHVQVRVVGGTVNVVGTATGPARLELAEIDGPPLTVTHEGDTLTVGYEDVPWKGWLKWLDRKGWNRTVHLTLAVPAGAEASIGGVGVGVVVSGLTGSTDVHGVSGDITLVRLTGPVSAETVSGRVEAQAVTGRLRFNSVSGDLTVIEGSGDSVRADTVSGDILLDLAPAAAPGRADIALTTVSGEIAIRLPHPADAQVHANTASGAVSNAFEDLRVTGQWGAKRIFGRLGEGNGRLKATTVSGAIALLRRPPTEDDTPTEDTPTDGAPTGGDAPSAGAPADPAQGPDRPEGKVL
ncbi:DUF4097 family beta strand repeat-containing protein [Streptomyces sparsogenes]|uniref:DUF4097 domain-containing protein n=1 Tax=Streptomyces sparsogenes DSM 40356 TaxID=1331668 RepID=A0A1R1SPI3_9ACTN|nr:DUF4097 family beta strand repeat-containing protein [Streptomyces sparsogenes]OMI40163.1 hypothetical protein SPAR_07227 [Streptomyces sparsogenes DSM 40356]